MSGHATNNEAWADAVGTSFPTHYQRIVAAVNAHPDPRALLKLFADLANSVQSDPAALQVGHDGNKKRKLESHEPVLIAHTNGALLPSAISNPFVSFDCEDVSFQVPARKKLRLQIVGDATDPGLREVRLLHASNGEIQHALPAASIDQVFCLPVPDKQQRQANFVLFPKPGATLADGSLCEQVVFTMPVGPPATVIVPADVTEQDTYLTITERKLNNLLADHGKRVIVPNEREFASTVPQWHRKGEQAYHVKAHRGNKEGYLFFLDSGIVFGFKKPLAFFPFSAIDSISYTSVLQRTFNLVIAATEDDGDEAKEVEFSMLDQADFGGIDEYVKRHGLNDASMAADRRAKAFNINKKADANGDAAGAGAADGGQSELQKAEEQLQDEEDELEEDYEASGGESDGEGDESDEDDDAEYEYGDVADEQGADEVEHEEDVDDENVHDG